MICLTPNFRHKWRKCGLGKNFKIFWTSGRGLSILSPSTHRWRQNLDRTKESMLSEHNALRSNPIKNVSARAKVEGPDLNLLGDGGTLTILLALAQAHHAQAYAQARGRRCGSAKGRRRSSVGRYQGAADRCPVRRPGGQGRLRAQRDRKRHGRQGGERTCVV